MYAYMDESGNTGRHIFDADQPLFVVGVMVTKRGFDAVYAPRLKTMAQRFSTKALHGAELGEGGIELIAPGLLDILKVSGASFHFSTIEKQYMAATRIYCCLPFRPS